MQSPTFTSRHKFFTDIPSHRLQDMSQVPVPEHLPATKKRKAQDISVRHTEAYTAG
jgi:hypothetical protein